MIGSLKGNDPIPESLQVQPSIHFEKIYRKPFLGPSNSAIFLYMKTNFFKLLCLSVLQAALIMIRSNEHGDAIFKL